MCRAVVGVQLDVQFLGRFAGQGLDIGLAGLASSAW